MEEENLNLHLPNFKVEILTSRTLFFSPMFLLGITLWILKQLEKIPHSTKSFIAQHSES